ncbi:MAG: glycerate kinase [Halanaeroarchaeum sp.]
MVRNRDDLASTPERDLALSCIEAGIEAAQPDRVVRESVALDGDTLRIQDATYDLAPYRRIAIVGGGKAAAHVASALESILGDRLDEGVIVTDDPAPLSTVGALPGDHPVPSERGVESTRTLLDTARDFEEKTLVLAVITGGGSALMAAPAPELSLADLRETTESLLQSGASIHEINAVRKHCSAIKGGQLATALTPATVVALVVSDVVGNDLDVVASGPTVPDGSTYDDALAVLDRYDVDVPDAVRDHLEAGAAAQLEETPSSGDPAFEAASAHVLADGFTALAAAAEVATDAGYATTILSSRIEGEARNVGVTHAAIAEEVAATGNPISPPAVVLSGGETTVAHDGGGTGGPNQEFVLSAARALGVEAVVAAVDTDGIDGSSSAAGGMLDARVDDPVAGDALDAHDVTPFLEEHDALVLTGRTGTNVNDLRVLVVSDADGATAV